METEGRVVLKRMISFVEGVMRRMFPAKNIKEALQLDTCLSEAMKEKTELWAAMYKGTAPWCEETVKSLRIEQGICREFTNICLNEMETSVSNDKLEGIYKFAIRDLNEKMQYGLAIGSFIIKPLGGRKVEYITLEKFIPIKFDEMGRLVNVIFVQRKTVSDNEYYSRFEQHEFEDGMLTISNRAFVSDNPEDIGREIPLKNVEEWAGLPERISYKGLERPDFGYYRNPIDNTVDKSFCGVSIYDSSIDLIEKADIQIARLDWEFESGERAVHVDEMALRPRPVAGDGKTRMEMPKLNNRLFRGLNLDGGKSGELYKEWSPEFRDENIINGLNTILRRIEFNTSLSYGDLSDVSDVDKTATEARIAKKRKYNMVTAIQNNLKDCLEDLVYALAFYNAMTHSGYEFTCTFKDSILVDEETERKEDRSDVGMGAMPLWEYRMKWYGEDKTTAKSMVTSTEGIIE